MPVSFKVASSIRYRIIDDEAVVVRQREGDVVVLNQVAARVLELVGANLSPDEMVAALVEEYEADEETIRADVERFLAELQELRVIEPARSSRNPR